MQEISVPPLVQPTTHGNLSDLPHGWAQREPARPLFSVNEGGQWRDVSAADFTEQVRGLAKGFIAAGVEIGDRVAIMSRTRFEWTLTDFALWTAGAVPVPVYETSSEEQVRWILQDSGAVAIVVEDAAHMALVTGIREDVPDLRDVWQIEGGALDEVASAGAEVTDEDVDLRRSQLDRTAPATIIYTSGTTGRPKGCVLTHDNFMALAENAIERLDQVLNREGASTLLFLPLAHVFARFIQVAVVAAGARMGHSPDVKNLLDDLAAYRPTFLLAVPRVFEKVYNSAEQKAAGSGKVNATVFARAAAVASAWSRAQDTGGPGLALKAQHALFDTLVYSKLREAMGGRVEYAISGGAALGDRLGHFFRGVGITILEGYGLTETTAPVGVNTPEQVKIGTVGRPLPGVAVRISDEGEILVKGCNVFDGYFKNDEATASSMADGWLRTGDLGSLDDEGFLTVTGRSKELLVTAGGKNVSPAPLEDRLRAHVLVGQCMVVGEGRPFIAALVTLDEEMWPTWSANHGLEGVSLEEARTHEAVVAAVQEGVDQANKSVSRAESIRSFTILAKDFTEANGYLTPSLKLRRHVVVKDFADEIEALYNAPR
ncbi:AMP-dependent synthetase/ligase [Ornithinicoccus hortensis]|uniref:Acyl-CoA synthetase n=1 Tax=Ornithinicoccus hortensis TaxID=82346 RepID=A0A542YRB9_9MICO|nr:AMP-dependent synthetase/ligase [Ornithinicoccus hortensis]TQL50630.1 long-chain acyl-CoA synthetase [Ornithinicoccus hortensis]